ncbi:MAG: serine/threonine protein kinase [Clostridia bacterium]|nr:serine/threonine protein kinase [Clostridia bacterium]
MENTLSVCGVPYTLLRLLGHGKGGYSYLAERDGQQVVLKQIHHEPCSYYTFGDKMAAELGDYERLRAAGIRVPELLAFDREAERLVKQYVPGDTVLDLLRAGADVSPFIAQAREMAALAYQSGLNIDYFPTNFVVCGGLIWYIDYECNAYMEEWSFERWGIQYWSHSPALAEYLRANPAAT